MHWSFSFKGQVLCNYLRLLILKKPKKQMLNLSVKLGLKLSHKQRLCMAETQVSWAVTVCKEMTNFPVPDHELNRDLFSQRMVWSRQNTSFSKQHMI